MSPPSPHQTAAAAKDFPGPRRTRAALDGAYTALLAALIVAAPAQAQEADPLHIRNLNPAVAVFGLPAWDTPVHGTRLGLTVDAANHYRLSQRGQQLFLLDGETWRTNFSFAKSVGENWFFGAEVPYFRISGGILDNLIDGWHSFFNLPDGGRNARPENALLFELGDPNGDFFLMNRPQSGLGDVQLKLGRTIGPGEKFVVEGTLKLPTGEERMLAGSGSADVSLTLLRSQALTVRHRPAGYYWGLGLVYAGNADVVPFVSNHWVYTGIVGGSWKLWPKFGIKAQLDVHGPFYDSAFEEIGETAIQATVGAWVRRGARTILDFAVVEDLQVSTAPDVVLQMAVRWQW